MILEFEGNYFRTSADPRALEQTHLLQLPDGRLLASAAALANLRELVCNMDAPTNAPARLLHDDLGYHSVVRLYPMDVMTSEAVTLAPLSA